MTLRIPMNGQPHRSQLCSAPPGRNLARNVQRTEAVPSVQPIVRAATKPEIIRAWGAEHRPRLNVIELEKSPRLAATSVRGYERTPAMIS
jgi:hypothetical protein